MSRFRIIGEFLQFLWSNKKFWLLPIVVILLALSIIVFYVEKSAVFSFIYPMF